MQLLLFSVRRDSLYSRSCCNQVKSLDSQSFLIDLYNCLYVILNNIFMFYNREAGYPLSLFVDEFYKADRVQGMWSDTVMPVPPPDEWITPDEIKCVVCEPPPCPKQVGRPKKARIRSALESSSSNLKKKKNKRKKHLCSFCKSPHHNIAKCDINFL